MSSARNGIALLTLLVAASALVAQPHISSISPASAAAGTATLTINVYGTGFVNDTLISSGSTVQWNLNTSLATTYVGPTLLRASVPYTLIANQGTAYLTVLNSSFGPNPGLSNIRPFTISAPLPVGISHINPTSVVSGSGNFALFVYGNGFRQGGGIPYIPPSVVTWNGTALVTTYLQLHGIPHLRASVPASLVACSGTAQVRVENASPIIPFGSTQYSNIVDFTIAPATASPSISSMTPPSAVAGSLGFTFDVIGCNFAVTYTSIGPVSVPNTPKIVFDGTVLTTTYIASTQLRAFVPTSLIAAARTAQVRVRNMLSNSTWAESAPADFAVLPPAIVSLAPPAIGPMGPASAPVQLVVTGSRFLAGATIHADGTPLPTTWVSATELRAEVGPALVQTQRPGGIAINVANAVDAVSNTVPLPVGSGSNRGTVRRHPLNPAPGAAYSARVEGGHPGGVVTLVSDPFAPPPVTAWPSPAVDLVLAVATAGPPIPLVDGFGLFSPATGATLDAAGGLTVPGFILPNPSLGISLSVQAIYLDPTAPLGFTLTWPRFPDTL